MEDKNKKGLHEGHKEEAGHEKKGAQENNGKGHKEGHEHESKKSAAECGCKYL